MRLSFIGLNDWSSFTLFAENPTFVFGMQRFFGAFFTAQWQTTTIAEEAAVYKLPTAQANRRSFVQVSHGQRLFNEYKFSRFKVFSSFQIPSDCKSALHFVRETLGLTS